MYFVIKTKDNSPSTQYNNYVQYNNVIFIYPYLHFLQITFHKRIFHLYNHSVSKVLLYFIVTHITATYFKILVQIIFHCIQCPIRDAIPMRFVNVLPSHRHQFTVFGDANGFAFILFHIGTSPCRVTADLGQFFVVYIALVDELRIFLLASNKSYFA